jgi:tetratricopeptide (TPR) repeat protein
LAAVTAVLLAVWAGGCTVSQTADSSVSGQAAAADVELRRQQAVSLYVDAMMLNDLNDYAGALQKLEEATALDNEFALAFSLKGDMYQAQQQYAQSADAYERAAQLDPWSFKDFFNLGKVSQILKQFERAVNAYVAASKLDPNHYESHMGAAKCYFELKDMAAAQQYAQKAKELDASQADPELLLGDILAEKKEHIEAIAAYRRALELQGNQPKIMVALARAYLRTGRFSSAKELLADVIVAEPDNAVAHQYMGFAQLKLKETEAAIESYKTAVKLNDNDWMAHKSLGVAYMLWAMQNSNDEKIKSLAMEQWNISLQLNPDQPQLKELQSKYN